MSYQVIARKWRPQKFDDVVGQQAVTRTLRNALASGRLAQAFVFAGPARRRQDDDGAHSGAGAELRERADGRSVRRVRRLRRDRRRARHGRPRDRRRDAHAGRQHPRGDHRRPVDRAGPEPLQDLHHRRSPPAVEPSFNALLKSIEEPPPHVVFMMATTELDKIPETVLSRSQVYEFRTISTKAIAEQLRRIVDAEGIAVGDESLQLIARDAEGSMRDAQSKLDQVIAFTGKTIAAEDVATVLGLVGRDLLLDTVQAVADEDAPAAFALAARAVEMGYDLRAVCRELSRVVRDLLVLTVDPSRISDPEIAGEGERDRLKALAGALSRARICCARSIC